MKDRYLADILDPESKNNMARKVPNYVNLHLNYRKPGGPEKVSYADDHPLHLRQRITSKKKYKVLKNYHKSILKPQTRPEDELSLEWNIFLTEKTDSCFDFVDY